VIHVERFVDIKSQMIPLDMTNVDTDQIIPKQFLKLIQKSGYGDFFFMIGVLAMMEDLRRTLFSMTQNLRKDKSY